MKVKIKEHYQPMSALNMLKSQKTSLYLTMLQKKLTEKTSPKKLEEKTPMKIPNLMKMAVVTNQYLPNQICYADIFEEALANMDYAAPSAVTNIHRCVGNSRSTVPANRLDAILEKDASTSTL